MFLFQGPVHLVKHLHLDSQLKPLLRVNGMKIKIKFYLFHGQSWNNADLEIYL